MTYEDFRSSILKLKEKRNHKIKNSWGVYDAYKYIRKNKWFNIKTPLTEKEFYSIIRTVNKYLAEELSEGKEVIFPLRMGKVELRKLTPKIILDGKKIKTNLPIDWDRTLKLWYEDKESYENKTLLKIEAREMFKTIYNRRVAKYVNKTFYNFSLNREIKIKLKQNIRNGDIDAFNINNYE